MSTERNQYLILGAALSAGAALLHLACIVVGAPMYRLMGAGERLAQMDLNGHWLPTALSLSVAAVLSVFALYALSGAGVIRRLPVTRFALCVITAIYFFRGVAFTPLVVLFPDNTIAFWLLSGAACVGIAVVHMRGLKQAWWQLGGDAPQDA